MLKNITTTKFPHQIWLKLNRKKRIRIHKKKIKIFIEKFFMLDNGSKFTKSILMNLIF